jgi:hypothetical protein
MKLHITPDVLGKMYFYDIMMLYNRYDQYVQDEQESQKEQQKQYEAQQEEYNSKYSNISSQMANITRGMGSMTPSSLTSGFNFPKI